MDSGTTASNGADQHDRYELTARAKTCIWVVLLAIAGLLAYEYRLGLRPSPPSNLQPTPFVASAANDTAKPASQQPFSSEIEPKHGADAKTERTAQMNTALQVAWRAAFDEQGKRLADAEKTLQDLDALIAAMPKNAPVKQREEAVATSHTVRRNIDATKAVRIDVSTLPIEFVTPEKSGINNFSRSSVSIGGDTMRVGMKLPSGEMLIAVDPESRTVVTDKRIVTVTN